MKRIRKEELTEPQQAYFGFRSDGSSATYEAGAHRLTTELVEQMVRRRRNSPNDPPSAYVALGQTFAAFPSVGLWGEHWGCAMASTAAEEAVKRAGRGPGPKDSPNRWHGNDWRSGQTREQWMGDKVSALVDEF